jgi:UDP-N-acetylmuramoyl-L-alanyl-D-glutamate--2,6-diaminopimelate ligase
MIGKVKSLYHLGWAIISHWLFGFPSRKIFVVGVTGTKGKSTVLELMNAILEAAGKKTALFSSVRRKVGSKTKPNLSGNTMPGRFALQKFLAEAAQAKCDYALIEVTSQGVLQHRHRYIHWDAAVFLNLMPEHIEAHGSFENYREAKVDFFRSLAFSSKKRKIFFINESDANRHYFEEAARQVPNHKIIFFSRERLIKEDLASHYSLTSRSGRRLLNDWLLADFNLENAAAAVTFAKSQKIPWPLIREALDNFRGVPGRLEFVQKSPFAVVIDYAHTPESLQKVYEILRPEALSPGSKGDLICVLGSAGGGRDKWKRPVMGRIAATYCDKIILTNEDPYDEDPAEILRQIENGFLEAPASRLRPQNHFHVLDRRAAIKRAITLAKRGDVVIITGKGSEPWLHLARGEKVAWNERKVVEEVLEELQKA